jgi:antitoxin component of MazEF toxin-antitoxin module
LYRPGTKANTRYVTPLQGMPDYYGMGGSIMALGEQIKLVTLQRRGTATCVNVSNKLRAQLGWNNGDALRLDVIEGALVVTRVILPPAAQVIQTATRRDVAVEVQPVPDNKQDV